MNSTNKKGSVVYKDPKSNQIQPNKWENFSLDKSSCPN
jgi:hypothetical protein